MDLKSQRESLIAVFDELADSLQRDAAWAYSVLRSISPSATASDELNKTIRALRTYSKELPLLEGRKPRGGVAVSLPFNAPLYSMVLYSFGAVFGGCTTYVRPSSITSRQVSALFERYQPILERLPLRLIIEPGSSFLKWAAESEEIGTVLFTGAYSNLLGVADRVPPTKSLIYCGSGLNPFVVTADAFSGPGGAAPIADLAIRSRLYNSGQDCLCAERFYIHTDRFEDFAKELCHRVGTIRTGPFDDELADVVPLLGGISARLESLLHAASDTRVLLEGTFSGELVSPFILEVSRNSELLTVEKFGPVFVLARYESPQELDEVLDGDFRFGATVCGAYSSSILDTYPHTTANTSVIEAEAEDAHVPFGGRLRSGFARHPERTTDGPILYSVETTTDE